MQCPMVHGLVIQARFAMPSVQMLAGWLDADWCLRSDVMPNSRTHPCDSSVRAMVILELYSVPGGEPQVRALWMGSDVTSQIPGCPKTAGSLCPLPAFRAQVRRVNLVLILSQALCPP